MEKYNPNTPVDIVITRCVKSKEKIDSKLRQFEVGEKTTMCRKYADELVSIRKAVVAGSPEHRAWENRQQELKQAKPSLTTVQAENTQLKAEIQKLKDAAEKPKK